VETLSPPSMSLKSFWEKVGDLKIKINKKFAHLLTIYNPKKEKQLHLLICMNISTLWKRGRIFAYSLRGRDLICIRNPLKIHYKIFWSVLLGLGKVLTHIAISMQQHSFFSYSGKR
jgi:hypothetical protein